MSDNISFSKEDIIGVEAKHITYVTDRNHRKHDLHVVKEVVHLKDKRRIPRLRFIEDYERPWWLDPEANKKESQRTYHEKKDYEYASKLIKRKSTQINMPHAIAKALGDYSMGPNPRLRQLSRSPYLYGADVSSVCCLKNDYRTAAPDLISRNTVAGGDIETNVYEDGKDGQIICMSVSHKENVYLAYLKHWVSDLKDPVKETFEELERIPELVALRNGRNLKIEIEVVDQPVHIVINCIKRLHEWKPDFFSFWNISFDMSRILKTLEDAGVDPALVFSDPSVPNNYKYFHFRQDQAMTTTASGVTKSKGPEDQWHWITCPASFQPIDAMSTYRVTRLAKGKEPSYALDYILKKELNVDEETEILGEEDLIKFKKSLDKLLVERPGSYPYLFVNYSGKEDDWTPVEHFTWGETVHLGNHVRYTMNFGKLKFAETDHLGGIEWHIEMQKNHKVRYGLYNIIDSIRLEQLDEKINDLASSITLFSKSSDYKNFSSNPKRLCDDMHFWYLNRPEPCVIGTSSDQMVHELDQYVVGHDSWIVTLPSYMAGPNGLKCVKDLPDYKTLIFSHVADLDIVSTYPNVSQILNIARETTVMEFSMMKDISEHHRREVGVNLTGGRVNAIEICQKIMKAPKLDEMLKLYLDKKANSPK